VLSSLYFLAKQKNTNVNIKKNGEKDPSKKQGFSNQKKQ